MARRIQDDRRGSAEFDAVTAALTVVADADDVLTVTADVDDFPIVVADVDDFSSVMAGLDPAICATAAPPLAC
jgi:hypothetical protein